MQTLLWLLEPLRVLGSWLWRLVPANHLSEVVHVQFVKVRIYLGDCDTIVPQLGEQVLVVGSYIRQHEVIFEFLPRVLLGFDLLQE